MLTQDVIETYCERFTYAPYCQSSKQHILCKKTEILKKTIPYCFLLFQVSTKTNFCVVKKWTLCLPQLKMSLYTRENLYNLLLLLFLICLCLCIMLKGPSFWKIIFVFYPHCCLFTWHVPRSSKKMC